MSLIGPVQAARPGSRNLLSVGRPGVIRGGRHSQQHLRSIFSQFWLSMVSILKVSRLRPLQGPSSKVQIGRIARITLPPRKLFERQAADHGSVF